MKHILLGLLVLLALSAQSQTEEADEKLLAAGVMPYTYVNDTVYLLLGYDSDKPGWTDFGGGREWVGSLENQKRLETPKEIATREFFEECRKVFGLKEIDTFIDTDAYVTSASGVYRSYIIRIPYKPREEFRNSMIPIDDKFEIFNEKADYYWIPLSELKAIVRSGNNVLPNSPNQGVLYEQFHETLKLVLMDDSLDAKFK